MFISKGFSFDSLHISVAFISKLVYKSIHLILIYFIEAIPRLNRAQGLSFKFPLLSISKLMLSSIHLILIFPLFYQCDP